MTILEREIEAKLIGAVNRHGGMCLKWVCPGWAGVPDRIVLMPGGKVRFVELKRPKGGELSARQLWWGQKLQELGFIYWVIWFEDDVRAFEEALE